MTYPALHSYNYESMIFYSYAQAAQLGLYSIIRVILISEIGLDHFDSNYRSTTPWVSANSSTYKSTYHRSLTFSQISPKPPEEKAYSSGVPPTNNNHSHSVIYFPLQVHRSWLIINSLFVSNYYFFLMNKNNCFPF